MQVLLLAGTSEAQAVASGLAEDGMEVVASLAGRTREPAGFPCRVRTGGFGGTDGLVAWLRDNGTGALVDATHPFAPVMPSHAAAAAAAVGVPRLRLVRPPWEAGEGDAWHEVRSLAEAASTLVGLGARRVLLTTGRLDLAPFATVPDVAFVIRSIEPPDPQPLAGAVVVQDRGPFTVAGELALLRDRRIDAVVTKNSGGAATAPKLVAARMLGIPVVMVRRPPPPPGPLVATPDDAVAWLREQCAAVDAPAGRRR
jgi:precorrin-6A/cobalt-precorrin-6A reductase